MASGIAAGGLNDGLARLAASCPLSFFNHTEGETAFDGSERIEGLHLDKEV